MYQATSRLALALAVALAFFTMCEDARASVIDFIQDPANEPTATAPGTVGSFEMVGELDGIDDAGHRMGGMDRMFIIDNAWDMNRYRQLIPRLPEVDVSTHMLVVLTSWNTRPKSLVGVGIDGDTMVIGVNKPAVNRASETREWRPPRFIVARAPVWSGHVRFEVNGKTHHTVWKSDALHGEAGRLWQEIMRLVNGGEPTDAQRLRYWRSRNYGMEIADAELLRITSNPKTHEIDQNEFFKLMFSDLVNMRATPVVAGLFALVEQAQPGDLAVAAASEAIIGIGGERVFEHCLESIKSKDLRRRQVAIGILAAFGLPETRQLARVALLDEEPTMCYAAFLLLQRVGFIESDVPVLLSFLDLAIGIERQQSLVESAIFQLGELGAAAKPAISTLEMLRHSRHPNDWPAVETALKKIEMDLHGSLSHP